MLWGITVFRFAAEPALGTCSEFWVGHLGVSKQVGVDALVCWACVGDLLLKGS